MLKSLTATCVNRRALFTHTHTLVVFDASKCILEDNVRVTKTYRSCRPAWLEMDRKACPIPSITLHFSKAMFVGDRRVSLDRPDVWVSGGRLVGVWWLSAWWVSGNKLYEHIRKTHVTEQSWDPICSELEFL